MSPAEILDAVDREGAVLRLGHGKQLLFEGPALLRMAVIHQREILWRVAGMRAHLETLTYFEPWPCATTKPAGPGSCHSCGVRGIRKVPRHQEGMTGDEWKAAVAMAAQSGPLRCDLCVDAAKIARRYAKHREVTPLAPADTAEEEDRV